MTNLRSSLIVLSLGLATACGATPATSADNDPSPSKDSGTEPTVDSGAYDPEADASTEPLADAGTPDVDAGKSDGGTAGGGATDAGKPDSGGSDAGTTTPTPKPAPPSGPVQGNPPVELIRPAPAIATSEAGSCTLAFATPWYFQGSPLKDAAGSPLSIYAQLRGKPLSGNQPLPGVLPASGPLMTEDTATKTFVFTVPSTNAEAMAGNHELTMHGYDVQAAAGQPDGTDSHDYDVWYDSLMNARCTPQQDLKFLLCDSWDAATKTWTPLAENNCRIAVTLSQTADGCKFTPHGNMGNFAADANVVDAENPFTKKCE